MNTLRFTTTINAPKERVWSTMLDDETYREWTSAFSEGSYYEGSWEEGSKMLFLSPDGNGMVAKIAENRPYEFISIEIVGFVQNGVEDIGSERKLHVQRIERSNNGERGHGHERGVSVHVRGIMAEGAEEAEGVVRAVVRKRRSWRSTVVPDFAE